MQAALINRWFPPVCVSLSCGFKAVNAILVFIIKKCRVIRVVKNKAYNVFSLVAFLVMGSFLAANQKLVQNITGALGATEQQMGLMISALFTGSTAAVLFVGELGHRMGKRQAALVTSVLVTTGSIMIFFARSVPLVVAGFFVFGSGSGGYESTIMSLAADNHGRGANRFLNLLQSLFSLGAVFTPLLLAVWLGHQAYRPLFLLATLLYAASACFFLFSRNIDHFAREGQPRKGMAFFHLIKDRRILLFILAMFVYVGSESALTFWIGTYYATIGLGDLAAVSLSVYWFSGIVGRLFTSRFANPAVVMAPAFLIAALGIVLLLLLPGAPLKLLAMALIGIGFSPVYIGLTLSSSSLFPADSAPVFSLMIFSAGLGGVAFQPLISRFVSSSDVTGAYWTLALLCTLTALLLAVSLRKKTHDPTRS